jgi:hypothetical protein
MFNRIVYLVTLSARIQMHLGTMDVKDGLLSKALT